MGQLRFYLLLLVAIAACLSVQVAPVVNSASVIGAAGGGGGGAGGSGHLQASINFNGQINEDIAGSRGGHFGGGGVGHTSSALRQQVVDIEEEAAAALVKVGALLFLSLLICLLVFLFAVSLICLPACFVASLLFALLFAHCAYLAAVAALMFVLIIRCSVSLHVCLCCCPAQV